MRVECCEPVGSAPAVCVTARSVLEGNFTPSPRLHRWNYQYVRLVSSW